MRDELIDQMPFDVREQKLAKIEPHLRALHRGFLEYSKMRAAGVDEHIANEVTMAARKEAPVTAVMAYLALMLTFKRTGVQDPTSITEDQLAQRARLIVHASTDQLKGMNVGNFTPESLVN